MPHATVIALGSLDDALAQLRKNWKAAAALDECEMLRALIEDAADGIHRAKRELLTRSI